MLEKSLELLKIFKNKGYEAYLVGGFVRDYVLGRQSNDVDICTNATPMQVKEIFKDVKLPFEQYGAVALTYKKVMFEITTYRMDLEYQNGRNPSKISYTNDLLEDLKRRDFTMNTLCMNDKGEVIDKLGILNDIKTKTIKSVGNADLKLKEDSLRILRAIRFATQLEFEIDNELKDAIALNKGLLEGLSYYRKKEELNKIFASPNAIYGLKLIREFGLDKYLGITVTDSIVNTSDPIGIWVQVNPNDKYQFTNNEKAYMKAILRVLEDKKINDMELYKEGNYVCYIASEILKMDTKSLHDRYSALPIKESSDIAVKPAKIIELLHLEDKSFVKTIIKDLEEKIVSKKLNNTKKDIKDYLINKYL